MQGKELPSGGASCSCGMSSDSKKFTFRSLEPNDNVEPIEGQKPRCWSDNYKAKES